MAAGAFPKGEENAAPSTGEIHEQLEHILSSKPFRSASRASRFLRYSVDQTLGGNAAELKEYVIATAVFGRPDSFDPGEDPIVRVEAVKLREKLKRYYDAEGAERDIHIAIPKGGYSAVFTRRQAVPAQTLSRPVFAGFPRKWALATALAAAIGLGLWFGAHFFRARKSGPVSIAVLPFLNISPDPGNDYLSDGMTEELTDALSRAGGLRVVSRTSAFRFRGSTLDVTELGKKLKADVAIEGSVRREGSRMRITAQLVNVADGYHLWSNTYSRESGDVFAVQAEIAQAVVSALRFELSGEAAARLTKRFTESPEAFDLYLQGRHILTRTDASHIDDAIRLFERSTEVDPNYALPYASMALAHVRVSIFNYAPAHDRIRKARAAAERAIALDPDLADAHGALAQIHSRYDFDWPAAQREFLRALELNPGSAETHNNYAQNWLVPHGHFDEALEENRIARELDPLSLYVAQGYPWILVHQGKVDEAITGFESLVAANPDSIVTRFALGYTYVAARRYSDAVVEFEKLPPGMRQSRTWLACACALAGQQDRAERIAAELESAAKTPWERADLAPVYIGLGRYDRAFDALNDAWQERDSYLIFLKIGPIFKPINTDPRYWKLLAQVGLSDPSTSFSTAKRSG